MRRKVNHAGAWLDLSRILTNASELYAQYLPTIRKHRIAQRKMLDKDVQSTIKLASWKDVNVYALRQSAVRSHHQLYKSFRKLREILQKPASDHFHTDEPAEGSPL